MTGASRGMGAAIASALAASGTDLTLVARDGPALAQLAGRLRSTCGVRVDAVTLDLSDRAGLDRWTAANAAALADTDLLVNNAAVADASPFLETDPSRLEGAFATNLFAPVALARAVLPGMIARGRGHVLNVVTTGARNGLPLFSAYAATKAALWSWSEALARELEGSGVTVTAFVPPHMDTATRRQLGRRALGWYRAPGADRAATPEAAAALALDAARRGGHVAMPAGARWQIALNAILPRFVDREIRRRWKGIAPPRAGGA